MIWRSAGKLTLVLGMALQLAIPVEALAQNNNFYRQQQWQQQQQWQRQQEMQRQQAMRQQQMLRDQQMRTSDVAFAVGYNDPHYFSYLFKKNTGMSPRDYRKGD